MISVQDLVKSFKTPQGTVTALDRVSFEVKTGKFFTLLGPSGCGKTTMLRSIAGLERPDGGDITIGGKLVYSLKRGIFVPANKRDIGMVFQSYAIWPHMTVAENVAFPLRVRGENSQSVKKRVSESLALVGLAGLEDRSATQLSGGQQQRVALARALVGEPEVLLLDEPLSNLDAKLRSQMRWELKELQTRVGTTSLYVTHDQIEALAISDEIALMNRGKIIQMGTPQEIYGNPVNEFAADFIGAANIIHGQILEGPDANGFARVETPVGNLCAVQKWANQHSGKEVLIAFRPEGVSISSSRPVQSENVLKGEVQGFTYLGESTEYHVMVGDHKLQAKAEPGSTLQRGTQVYLHIPNENCLLIRRGEV
jgi:iron(III) transport system ATP-binding protein